MRDDELVFSGVFEPDGDPAPLSKTVCPDNLAFTVFFVGYPGSGQVWILITVEEISEWVFIGKRGDVEFVDRERVVGRSRDRAGCW